MYGVLLIAVVLFLPQGAYPALRCLVRRAAGMSLLDVSGLTKRFGGLLAVGSLDLSMAKGEMLGLIGPNGAGKTTVFNLLSGFLSPDEGESASVGGTSSASSPIEICRLGMARTFQIVRPFPQLSVVDNVKVAALARHPAMAHALESARAVVERVGLGARAGAPRAASPWPTASGSSSRARSPPSRRCSSSTRSWPASTPPRSRPWCGWSPPSTRGGISVLLIEHNMRAVMALSHRIVVLSFGEKISSGTPREVAADRRVIEAYLGEEYVHRSSSLTASRSATVT